MNPGNDAVGFGLPLAAQLASRVKVMSIQERQLESSSSASQCPVMTLCSALNVPVNRSRSLRMVHTNTPCSSTRLASYAFGPSVPKYCVT